MRSKDFEKQLRYWENFAYKHRREDEKITFDSFLDGNSLGAAMASNSEFIRDIFIYNAELLLLAACSKYAKWHIPEVSMKFDVNDDITFIFALIIKENGCICSTDDISEKDVKGIGYRPTMYDLCYVADQILTRCDLRLENIFTHTYYKCSRTHNYEKHQIISMMNKLPDVYPNVQEDTEETRSEKIECPAEENNNTIKNKKLYAEN